MCVCFLCVVRIVSELCVCAVGAVRCVGTCECECVWFCVSAVRLCVIGDFVPFPSSPVFVRSPLAWENLAMAGVCV